MSDLISAVQPLFYICEDNFFFNKRPGSFKPLVECVTMLENVVYTNNPYAKLIKLAPKFVKKSIAVKLIDKKDSVKETIAENNNIMSAIKSNFNRLDEHSIDAIAIGYAYYNVLLGEFHTYNKYIPVDYKENQNGKSK